MPRKTPEVIVSPAVLKWARETAGYSVEAVAHHLRVLQDRVNVWEREPAQSRLTLWQLEELAHYCRRPTAALLLSEPPEEPAPPRDFRRPPYRDTPLLPELRLAIRRSYRLQRVAAEMMETLGFPSSSDITQAVVQEDPETLAKAQRQTFGVTVEEQLEWRDPREAFRRWREALEERRVLVFQGDFPREEAQGFSLSRTHPYAIVVTSKDPPTARCFTLFHEFAHLLLRESGLCLTEEIPSGETGRTETEEWCQRFAEAFLVDQQFLAERDETHAIVAQERGYDHALRRLATSFKVSQAVILFRLWHTDLISEGRFWAEYTSLQQAAAGEVAKRNQEKKGKGGPSPAHQAVDERGRLLTRLILEGLDREILGYTEVIDYLGVRLKHLDKIRRAAYR